MRTPAIIMLTCHTDMPALVKQAILTRDQKPCASTTAAEIVAGYLTDDPDEVKALARSIVGNMPLDAGSQT